VKKFLQRYPYKDILVSNRHPGDGFTNEWSAQAATVGTSIYCSHDELFSGYFYHNSKLHFDQNDIVRSRPLSGAFVSFFVSQGKVVARNDIFGFGLIYIYQSGVIWAISNRYEMILDWARSSGSPLSLNTAPFIRGLTHTAQCFMQRHCRESDFHEVELLPLDERVSADLLGLCRETNYDFVRMLSPSGESYADLIDEAAQDIIDNTKAVVDTSALQNIVCDLSGGFDSRLVFAAAMNCDRPEKLLMRSLEVANSPDLEIATTIIDSFGLPYLSKVYHQQSFQTVEDSLGLAASYFLGEYFSYGKTAWSNEGNNQGSCRLSGGGGELYRGVNLKKGNLSATDPARYSELSSKVVDGIEIYKRGVDTDTLQQELDRLPGDSHSRTELHYVYYRNRLHYGMRSWDSYHDLMVYQTGVSMSLFKASRLLTGPERAAEKAMLDVTNRIFPLLTSFPYGAKGEIDYSKLLQSDKRIRTLHLPTKPFSERWSSATGEFRNSVQRVRRKITPEEASQWRLVDEHMRAIATASLETVANRLSGRDEESAQLEKFITNGKLIGRNLSVFSKVISLARQIDSYCP